MERIIFKDYEGLACTATDLDCILNEDNDEYSGVSIIAEYEDAKMILAEIISLGYDIGSIEIEEPELSCYCDAFIITLCDERVDCEKMKREHGYLTDESAVTFLFDDCNCKIIENIEADLIFETSINKNYARRDYMDEILCDLAKVNKNIICDDECCEERECPIHPTKCGESKNDKAVHVMKDLEDDMHGFQASRSDGNGYVGFSYYTTEKLNDSKVNELLKRFGF